VTIDDPLGPLLQATAAGDRTAFQRLYAQTSPRLFAVALRLLRHRDQAEDLLQEVYLKIWHKARLFDPGRGTAIVWMITLVRRAALDKLRETGRRPREVSAEDPTIDLEAFAAPEGADRGPETQKLTACLKDLDGTKREAILFAFYYGCTHDELAVRLNKPVGTVKSWIRRGLRELKRCLEQ
jgi:RNA polymerase sigma-70 factor (ECF subfamily)